MKKSLGNKEKKIPIWKTITIGGKSAKQLLEELEKSDFKVSDWVKDIMSKSAFTTSSNPVEISLARIKVRDLGFTEMPTTNELFARAKEQELYLCPVEVGPHLRLSFNDQSLGDYCWISMEPISDYAIVFELKRVSDERWLDVGYATPDVCWLLDDDFVFCFRK